MRKFRKLHNTPMLLKSGLPQKEHALPHTGKMKRSRSSWIWL